MPKAPESRRNPRQSPGLEAAKRKILGSDYVGAFCIPSDRYVIVPVGMTASTRSAVSKTLGVECLTATIGNSDILGIFGRANSNGLALSSLASETEVAHLKRRLPYINIGIVHSDLNAVGNNIIANDRIAMVNHEYQRSAIAEIGDILGVEVLPIQIGGHGTVGATNILTNRGMAINNNTTDDEKEKIEHILGVNTIRTTANTGSLNIGIAAAANSSGIIVGDSTTGFEIARLMETLE